MGSNQTYIEKADLAVSDLTTGGGLLVPEQAKKFFEIAIEESTLLQLVTTPTMTSPTWELPKANFAGRVLRRATESAALPVADRAKPDLSKVQIVTTEFIAEARIPYAVVEDNIENGTFPQTVLGLLGKRVAADMETLVIMGDTLSADPFLASFDGILKKATSNVVNAGGVRLSKSTLKTMLQTMPVPFRKGMTAFLTSTNAVIDYIDSLSNRQTLLGDDALAKKSAAEYMGLGIVPVQLFPETLGSGNKTNVLLLDPKNIHVGMHRDVRIETGRDISARQFIVVATVRFGFNYAHEPAIVKATEVLAEAG